MPNIYPKDTLDYCSFREIENQAESFNVIYNVIGDIAVFVDKVKSFETERLSIRTRWTDDIPYIHGSMKLSLNLQTCRIEVDVSLEENQLMDSIAKISVWRDGLVIKKVTLVFPSTQVTKEDANVVKGAVLAYIGE